jgi:hypothetical protein
LEIFSLSARARFLQSFAAMITFIRRVLFLAATLAITLLVG